MSNTLRRIESVKYDLDEDSSKLRRLQDPKRDLKDAIESVVVGYIQKSGKNLGAQKKILVSLEGEIEAFVSVVLAKFEG